MSKAPPDRAYHVSRNGERFGPISGFELSRRRLTSDMLVWWRGLPEWIPIETVPELAPYVTLRPVEKITVPPPVIPGRPPTVPPPIPNAELSFDPSAERSPIVLAGRGTRLAAVLLDGLIMSVALWPLMYGSGYLARVDVGSAAPNEEILWALIGGLVFMAFHGYLLTTRGQTIGKYFAKIQIVDSRSHRLLPFVRVLICRYFWLFPAVVVTAMIPGQADNLAISALTLLDAIMIFGAARRCLHDYFAGSIVIAWQPARTSAGSWEV
jgi:uncharacterized RDD family membrane protein YckC